MIQGVVLGMAAAAAADLASTPLRAQSNQQARQDLTGEWTLNRDLSMDPREARNGGRIVAETKVASIRVVETFAIAAEEQQLVIVAQLYAPTRGPVGERQPQVRRVYDRVSGSEARSK